jgi:hypothetical protein|tara:strand:+ start:480 stop:698 length:219 start_codon:yes stop_codon:yes gene_type:complete
VVKVVVQAEIKVVLVALEEVEEEVTLVVLGHLVRVTLEETQTLAQAPVAAVEPGKLETQMVLVMAVMAFKMI